MSTILDSVTEIEERIVETVRSIQQPVVDYVSKGVEWAEGRFPKPTYPENLPKPGEVIESQFNFAKALLDTQREFVSELADAVAPLVRAESETDEPVKAQPAKATAAAPAAPAAKATTAKPAAKTTKKTTK